MIHGLQVIWSGNLVTTGVYCPNDSVAAIWASTHVLLGSSRDWSVSYFDLNIGSLFQPSLGTKRGSTNGHASDHGSQWRPGEERFRVQGSGFRTFRSGGRENKFTKTYIESSQLSPVKDVNVMGIAWLSKNTTIQWPYSATKVPKRKIIVESEPCLQLV